MATEVPIGFPARLFLLLQEYVPGHGDTEETERIRSGMPLMRETEGKVPAQSVAKNAALSASGTG